MDMYVLRLGLVALRVLWGSDTDLTPIADEVAAGDAVTVIVQLAGFVCKILHFYILRKFYVKCT